MNKPCKVLEFTGGLQELSDSHKLMVQMDITGRKTRKEIAKACHFSVGYINGLFRDDPKVIEYRQELMQEIGSAAKRIRMAAETELEKSTLIFTKTLVDIAQNPKASENARVSAARFGLQFAGMRLEDPDKNEVKTPHLAIRDDKKAHKEIEKHEKKVG